MGRRMRRKSKRARFDDDSPGRVDLDDLLGDGLEGRAIVDRGFHDQDLLRERVDADEPDHLRIEGLPPIGDEYHLDVVDVQHRGGAEAAGQPGHHRPAVHEAPVRERADGAGHPQGSAVTVVHLAADLEGDAAAHARLDARLHRGRVPDAGHRRAARAHPQELAQDLGAVARGAAAGVVGHVGQHDGTAGGGQGLGHRVLHRPRGVDELVAMRPRHPLELGGEPLGQGLIVVGDHVDAEPGVGNVRVREAREDRHRDDLRILLHLDRRGRRAFASARARCPGCRAAAAAAACATPRWAGCAGRSPGPAARPPPPRARPCPRADRSCSRAGDRRGRSCRGRDWRGSRA